MVHRDIEPKHLAKYGSDRQVCMFDFSSAVFLPQAAQALKGEASLRWYSGGSLMLTSTCCIWFQQYDVCSHFSFMPEI